MSEGLQNTERMRALLRLFFSFQFRCEPNSFVIGKPARLVRPVGKIEDCDKAKDYGRHSLNDEQPAPSGHAEPVHTQEQAGNRRTNKKGDRLCGHEQSKNLRPVLVPKPVAEINDDTWKESCFCRAQ